MAGTLAAAGGRQGAPRAAAGRLLVSVVRVFHAASSGALEAGEQLAAGPGEKLLAAVWPPRRGTHGYYIAAAVVTYAYLYFAHVRNVRTKEAEGEDNRKSEYALISMRNMCEYEDYREKALAAAAAGDDESDAAVAESGDAAAAKKLKPADARKLFDLLYDHVENAPVTAIGVPSDDPMYTRLVALLGVRATEELVNATERTQQSRDGGAVTMEVEEYEDSVGKYAARDYYDGQKLLKQVKFAKDEVGKHFGKGLVGAEAVFGAKTLLAEIAKTRKAARQRIVSLIAPHFPKWLAGTLILMGTETCFSFLVSWSFGLPQMLTTNPHAGTMAETLRSCITLVVAYIMIFPIDTVGDALIDDVEAEVQLKLRSAIMSTVMSQDREYFDTHQVGELQERLNNDTAQVARMAIAQPKTLCSCMARFVSNTVVMFYLSPKLTLLALAVPVPVTVIVGLVAVRVTRRQNKKIGRVNDRAASNSIEVLRELSTVRQFGMERAEVAAYVETATWRMQLERRLRVTQTMTFYVAFQTFRLARLTNIYYGVMFVVQGSLDPASVLMAVFNSQVIINTAQSMFNVASEVMLVLEPLERVAALIESKPKIEPSPDIYELSGDSDSASKDLGVRPEKFTGNFVFEDVHFAYPTEKQKRVLNGMSFEVPPGSKVALVGKAGCGKSTAISLVQRFYDPLQGRVLLDGVPLVDYDLHYLRSHIGVVAQDNILFSKSLWDNITYGMGTSGLPKATKKMVDAACAAANATEFINEFPNKLATFVGEKGVKLSGGQKQRIAIARAIIRSPPILLLDEATSALDSVNEKVVQKALDEMLHAHNGVAIVIAHRLTTIKNCDKIVVCDKGIKVEEGTHDELMMIPTTFKEDEKSPKAGDTAESKGEASVEEKKEVKGSKEILSGHVSTQAVPPQYDSPMIHLKDCFDCSTTICGTHRWARRL